ncbi:MAG: helix-turn-helix domain-containing protein [Chloroflexi bacterium]|nr:helix-turn-helix domain-containing protein [Chloroflexota bacterium]
MDLLPTLNQALEYIEAHLTGTTTAGEVARAVGYSRFHFDRLFLEVVGETLALYMRRRRLSEAARELVTSGRAICDIALDYQFGSQEAFTRAFKRVFGLSPRAYRRRQRLTRFQPPIQLTPPRLARASTSPNRLWQAQSAGLHPARMAGTILFTHQASRFNRSPDRVHLVYW